MKPELRRPEQRTMSAAAEKLGLRRLIEVPPELYVEGGDVVPFVREGRRGLMIGYGPRTRRETLEFLQQALIPEYLDEIIGVRLADWRMNLDGGLLPVSDDVVVSDTASIEVAYVFDAHGHHAIDVLSMLRDLGYHIIDTHREESVYAQSCNCLCLGDRKVVYYDLCDRVHRLLLDHGIQTYRFPGSELVKGRGGPRCMSRPIYKDVAVPPGKSVH